MKIELDDRRLEIFRELENGCGGEEIAKKFGLSRTAVWKFVNKLEELGYEIERRRYYRIVSKPDPSPFDMAIAVREIPGIKEFYYFHEIDSTNSFAKKLENSAVFAEIQTSGKGRVGRRWESEKGGIYFSVSLNLSLPVHEIPKITLLSGLAVARTLESYVARIKWPNDVLVNGKKVSGILSEFVGEELSSKVVVGIGINVKNPIPDFLRDRAISLAEVNQNVRITDVFKDLCRNLGDLLSKFPDNWNEILEEWKKRSDTLGKDVEVRIGGEVYKGKALDIDMDGGLVIESEGRRDKIISGECFYTNY